MTAPKKKFDLLVSMHIVAALGITFLLMLTYYGPFAWIAELQLRWFGVYYEKLTFILTFIPTLLLTTPKQVLLSMGKQTSDPAATGAPPAPPTRLAQMQSGIVVLVLLGFVIAGIYKYLTLDSSAPFTNVSVEQLEAGQARPSTYLHVRGVALKNASIRFGKTDSEETFMPVVSGTPPKPPVFF